MYVFLSAFCYDLFLRCYYHSLSMEFLRNVAADIWVEYTEPEQRSKLFNLINKEK